MQFWTNGFLNILGMNSLKHNQFHEFQCIFACFIFRSIIACNRDMSLIKACDSVGRMKHFTREEYDSDGFGFPECSRDRRVCMHTNSSLREEIIALLGYAKRSQSVQSHPKNNFFRTNGTEIRIFHYICCPNLTGMACYSVL